MRTKLATLLFILGSILAAQPQQGLNNDSIGKMIKAGLSDDVIVRTIVANTGRYDISPDGLSALKAAGASDRVITAVKSQALWLSSDHVIGSITSSVSEPKVKEPEQLGKVFYVNPETKALQSVPGEPWRHKNRSGFGSWKSVDIVNGKHSKFRVSSKDRVVFVFRPLPGQYPQEIRLYPFEVKGDERECVVSASKNGFGGGTETGNANAVTLEVVRYGLSSYALNAPGFHLEPGEYLIASPGRPGLNDPLITLGVD